MLTLKVKYKNDIFPYQIKKITTNSAFIKLLAKELCLEPNSIKLFYKGKTLANSKENKLVNDGIKDGDKILLTAVDKSIKLPKPKRSGNKKQPKNQQYEDIPIPDIVRKGPPPGCMDGLHAPVSKFPKTPFVVYTKDGSIAKLSIESDALFVEYSDGAVERLFDISYNAEKTQDVPNFSNYISLYINTNDELRVYHYIPKQFQNLFKDFLNSLSK